MTVFSKCSMPSLTILCKDALQTPRIVGKCTEGQRCVTVLIGHSIQRKVKLFTKRTEYNWSGSSNNYMCMLHIDQRKIGEFLPNGERTLHSNKWLNIAMEHDWSTAGVKWKPKSIHMIPHEYLFNADFFSLSMMTQYGKSQVLVRFMHPVEATSHPTGVCNCYKHVFSIYVGGQITNFWLLWHGVITLRNNGSSGVFHQHI
jgi:hypothetical protein